MPEPDVVEIVQVGQRQINRFLDGGYRILHIDTEASPGRLSDGRPFVLRRVVYVLGRSADVAHLDKQPYVPPTESPPAESELGS